MNALPIDPLRQSSAGHDHRHSRYAMLAEALVPRDVRHEMIAEAAYFRAERRGFAPGHELEDWLAAEAEIDTGLTLGIYCSER